VERTLGCRVLANVPGNGLSLSGVLTTSPDLHDTVQGLQTLNESLHGAGTLHVEPKPDEVAIRIGTSYVEV
jgi:hypothetical protein